MISRRQLLLGMAAAPVVAALPASAEPIGRGMARILEIPCAPLAGGQKYTLSYWAKPEGADRWMKISRVLEAWQGQVAVQIEQASIVSDYCDAQLTGWAPSDGPEGVLIVHGENNPTSAPHRISIDSGCKYISSQEPYWSREAGRPVVNHALFQGHSEAVFTPNKALSREVIH